MAAPLPNHGATTLHCKQIAVGFETAYEVIDLALADGILRGEPCHDIGHLLALCGKRAVFIKKVDVLHIVQSDSSLLEENQQFPVQIKYLYQFHVLKILVLLHRLTYQSAILRLNIKITSYRRARAYAPGRAGKRCFMFKW